MRNIILLGFVSFFSDVSAEMVYPLIPLYLTSAFVSSSSALIAIVVSLDSSSVLHTNRARSFSGAIAFIPVA